MLKWKCLRASGETPGWDGGCSHRAVLDTRDSGRRGCPSSHSPRRKVLSADDQLDPGGRAWVALAGQLQEVAGKGWI